MGNILAKFAFGFGKLTSKPPLEVPKPELAKVKMSLPDDAAHHTHSLRERLQPPSACQLRLSVGLDERVIQ